MTEETTLRTLASLAGRTLAEVPASPLARAALKVQLTTTAREQGATWATIAAAHGHTSPATAKRDAHRLETAVRRELKTTVTTAALTA